MAAIEISVPVNVSMTPQEISIPVDIDASLLDGGWITETETLQDGSRIVTYYKTNGLRHGIIYYDPQGAVTRADVYDNYREDGSIWYLRITEIPLDGSDVTVKQAVNSTLQPYTPISTTTENVRIRHAQRIFACWPGMEVLPLGFTVNMPWENGSGGTIYDNPMVLVTYGEFQKEGDPETTLTWMGIFMSVYGQSGVPFDGAEQEEATEETAQTGLHYYGRTGGTYTQLNLEDGDAVPYGDYDHVYHNEIDNVDTRNGRALLWWNHSAMRQYLNSDGTAGTWWHAQHIGDCAPNNISSRRGYLAGLSAEDAAALQKIRIRTGGDNEEDITRFDRVWIPSPWEMYGTQGESAGMDFDRYWQEVVGVTGNHRNTAIEARATTLLTIPGTATSTALRQDGIGYTYGPYAVIGSDISQGGQTYTKGQITKPPSAGTNTYSMRICVAVGG